MIDISHEKLIELVEVAKGGRLNPRQEQEAIQVVKGLMLTGSEGVSSVVHNMVNLPWSVGVNAIIDSWSTVNDSIKKQILMGITDDVFQTDSGKRFRLSLGRGFLKLDAPLGCKIIAAVAHEIVVNSDPFPQQKPLQTFFHIMIGKGRPWMTNIETSSWDPADLQAILFSGVAATFTRASYLPPSPPFTQLQLLKWAAPTGQLEKLPQPIFDLMTEAVRNWNERWQISLKRECTPLPEALAAVLPANIEALAQNNAEGEEGENGSENGRRRGRFDKREGREPREARGGRFERRRDFDRAPVVEMPEDFSFLKTVEQINSYVQKIESELESLRSTLSEKENALQEALQKETASADLDPRAKKGKKGKRAESDDSVESLQQHNEQLQETIQELQRRLEDLSDESEDIATSRSAHSRGSKEVDATEELRNLISIKLSEEVEEYIALEKEPMTSALGEHCRNRWGDVLEKLRKLGIEFAAKPAPKKRASRAKATA